MDEIQMKIWDVLCTLNAEDVARAFTNYHGNDLLSDGFAEFLVDDGYCEPEDLGLKTDDDEELTCPYCYDTDIIESKNGLHRCLGCGNEF